MEQDDLVIDLLSLAFAFPLSLSLSIKQACCCNYSRTRKGSRGREERKRREHREQTEHREHKRKQHSTTTRLYSKKRNITSLIERANAPYITTSSTGEPSRAPKATRRKE